MRLGGPVASEIEDPAGWVHAHRKLGYTAAYCPPGVKAGDMGRIAVFREAAASSDLLIAEVGAWSNPISPDDATRREAIRLCQERLTVAEELGANCCVNIAGSRSSVWFGPHPDNVSEDTFALIVDTVREIIDAVHPKRTFYTLETMRWIAPYDVDSYLRLLAAIDRSAFGVHLDPVNLLHSPLLCFDNAAVLADCFNRLGPYIKSCHAKDVQIRAELGVHIEEVRPGLGLLDYGAFVRGIRQLGRDVPLMIEHLDSEEEYRAAADYIRQLIDQ